MTGEIEVFGPVKFSRTGSKKVFQEIVTHIELQPPIIIKPNWSTSNIYTESELLDWILSTVSGNTVVVESYAYYRSRLLKEHEGPIDSDLEKKLANQKRKDHRMNDQWFLEFTGNGEVLEKHDVEYLNLSEEIWAQRVCEPNLIRELVHSRFSPLSNEILYSLIPTRLYDLRGGTLISLAKPKIAHGSIGVSITIKNLFGMIPPPARGKFHGVNDSKLNSSIIDITKICHSLFGVRGVAEAVFSTSLAEEHLMDSTVINDLGMVWGSSDVLTLDAFVTAQMGLNPYDIGHLAFASKEFGSWNDEAVKLGRANPIELKSTTT